MSAKLERSKVKIGITPTSWWNDDFLDIDIGMMRNPLSSREGNAAPTFQMNMEEPR